MLNIFNKFYTISGMPDAVKRTLSKDDIIDINKKTENILQFDPKAFSNIQLAFDPEKIKLISE